MATPSSSAVGLPRLKPKKPIDVWSTREKLCLASAVFKIGDQNWVSVSRAIKPYAEPNRSQEWFHQKNCLLQYYDMIEQLEQPKRKRGGDKSDSADTQSLQIMRKMTIERSEQIRKEMVEMQQEFKRLQQDCEEINAGQWDEKIEDVWEEIQREEKTAQELAKTEIKIETQSGQNTPDGSESLTFMEDMEDNTQSSVGDSVDISAFTDEECVVTTNSGGFATSTPVTASADVTSKLPVASHLLSSLLQSDVKTATGLQQLKQEHELEHLQGSQQAARSLLKTPVTQDDPLTAPPSSLQKLQTSSTSTSSSSILSPAEMSQATTTTSGSRNSLTVTTTASVVSSSTVAPIPPTSTIETINVDCAASSSMGQGGDVDYESLIEETVISDILETVHTDIPSVSTTPEVVPSVGNSEDSNAMPVVEGIQEEVVDGEDDEDDEVILKEIHDEAPTPTVDSIKETDSDVGTPRVAKDDLEKEDRLELALTPAAIKEEFEAETPVGPSEVDSLLESSIKEEPLSPTSSICSRVSETGSKRGRTRGRPRNTQKPGKQAIRKSYTTDDEKKDDIGSMRNSDAELSDEEVREDILSGQVMRVNASSFLSESFPNSPASMSMGSDTEEEKSFKQWKKSIMLVWRAAATHKYANVFMHPVTNDIAPGYHTVVRRPMDLSTIKKNVETGVIRATVDFQRDMMLMFTNAIMYNSSDHNVFKMAKEMYDDVMKHLEQYVNTQMMLQTADGKNLRQSRRPDGAEKEDEQKKRRSSVDLNESGGKTKKRKTRLDE